MPAPAKGLGHGAWRAACRWWLSIPTHARSEPTWGASLLARWEAFRTSRPNRLPLAMLVNTLRFSAAAFANKSSRNDISLAVKPSACGYVLVLPNHSSRCLACAGQLAGAGSSCKPHLRQWCYGRFKRCIQRWIHGRAITSAASCSRSEQRKPLHSRPDRQLLCCRLCVACGNHRQYRLHMRGRKRLQLQRSLSAAAERGDSMCA